jgi:hypothetical protein
MNQLITVDEVAGFLKNSTSVIPRPDFAKIRALWKHITQAPKQLDCPQSLIYGWAVLAMDPTMYKLIKLSPFIAPPNPGNVPLYPNFTSPRVLKMVEQLWDNARNYYLLYINISWACFCMLDENIPNQFKMSNDPTLIGWNPTMGIQLILTQWQNSFGQPSGVMMWNNNKLFKLDFSPNNAPESLFLKVEQCQEVTIIARNQYSNIQLFMNTMHLLLQSRIFLMKEFEDWEATTNKTWMSLKAFIHGAFQRRLMTVGICSTLAQHGYAPANNHAMLANKFVDLDNNTIVEHTAAGVTVGSTLGNTYATPAPTVMTNNNLTLAINLLASNQQALYQHIAPLSQHMAAMLFHEQPSLQARVFPSPNTRPFYVLPIQQLTILVTPQGGFSHGPPAFVAGDFNPG